MGWDMKDNNPITIYKTRIRRKTKKRLTELVQLMMILTFLSVFFGLVWIADRFFNGG